MCFGNTCASEDDAGLFKLTPQLQNVMKNLKVAHRDPLKFVIVQLEDGKVAFKEKIRGKTSTYEDYTRELDKMVKNNQLATLLHWFDLNGEIKFVRLNFDPPETDVTQEDRDKFFDSIREYMEQKYGVPFYELRGSTVEELNAVALETKYKIRYA